MTTMKWTPPKGWRWMAGMRHEHICGKFDVRVTSANYGFVGYSGAYSEEMTFEEANECCRPDLKDPATLGCLLAMVREAWGDPGLSVSGRYSHAGTTWHVVGGSHHGGRFNRMAAVAYPTEAEALLAALEAAP